MVALLSTTYKQKSCNFAGLKPFGMKPKTYHFIEQGVQKKNIHEIFPNICLWGDLKTPLNAIARKCTIEALSALFLWGNSLRNLKKNNLGEFKGTGSPRKGSDRSRFLIKPRNFFMILPQWRGVQLGTGMKKIWWLGGRADRPPLSQSRPWVRESCNGGENKNCEKSRLGVFFPRLRKDLLKPLPTHGR